MTKYDKILRYVKPILVFLCMIIAYSFLIRWFTIRILYPIIVGFTLWGMWKDRHNIYRMSWKARLSYLLWQVIPIGIVIWLLEAYAVHGLLGFALFVILIAVIRIFRQRKQFLAALRRLESMWWGKPLDKKNWKKGELKDLKIDREIVWSDKK